MHFIRHHGIKIIWLYVLKPFNFNCFGVFQSIYFYVDFIQFLTIKFCITHAWFIPGCTISLFLFFFFGFGLIRVQLEAYVFESMPNLSIVLVVGLSLVQLNSNLRLMDSVLKDADQYNDTAMILKIYTKYKKESLK